MKTLIEKLPKIKNNKLTIGLVLLVLVLLIGGFFIFQKFSKPKQEVLLPDIDLTFNAEGPYAVLTPRRDGNALILGITRIADYDLFSYQITYSDEKGIDRGAGDLNTWIKLKKGDYEQEILLGTCSQGYISGNEHCVFDKGVENGTLVLRIRKGKQPYKMLTQWHLQKPDVALGILTSGDNHLTYKMIVKREELAVIGFTTINDLTGVPKLPEGKQILGKAYAVNIPTAKQLPVGEVTVELAETKEGAKLFMFDRKENKWIELETKQNNNKLTASSPSEGIFAVLTNSNPK